MENEKVTMSLDDVICVLGSIARQTDTEFFSVLLATAIDIHCEEYDLDSVDFTNDLYDLMKIGATIKTEMGI